MILIQLGDCRIKKNKIPKLITVSRGAKGVEAHIFDGSSALELSSTL